MKLGILITAAVSRKRRQAERFALIERATGSRSPIEEIRRLACSWHDGGVDRIVDYDLDRWGGAATIAVMSSLGALSVG